MDFYRFKQTTSLTELPNECLLAIIKHVPFDRFTLTAFSLISRNFHHLIKAHSTYVCRSIAETQFPEAKLFQTGNDDTEISVLRLRFSKVKVDTITEKVCDLYKQFNATNQSPPWLKIVEAGLYIYEKISSLRVQDMSSLHQFYFLDGIADDLNPILRFTALKIRDAATWQDQVYRQATASQKPLRFDPHLRSNRAVIALEEVMFFDGLSWPTALLDLDKSCRLFRCPDYQYPKTHLMPMIRQMPSMWDYLNESHYASFSPDPTFRLHSPFSMGRTVRLVLNEWRLDSSDTWMNIFPTEVGQNMRALLMASNDTAANDSHEVDTLADLPQASNGFISDVEDEELVTAAGINYDKHNFIGALHRRMQTKEYENHMISQSSWDIMKMAVEVIARGMRPIDLLGESTDDSVLPDDIRRPFDRSVVE